MAFRLPQRLSILAPGILVAATGVGAGDLATAAFTGNRLGLAILWGVLAGAGMKFLLNEGLARWQLATGTTFVEGGALHLGRPFQVLFLLYLVFWSYFVGAALISACGAAAHALLPLFSSAQDGKIFYGILHTLSGVALVRWGGYRLFQRTMSLCVALMFVTVLATAILVTPDWGEILRGLFWPRIPDLREGGAAWTIALIGGVGGTVTILCYGYWIREEGRRNPSDMRICRIDLASGYAMTALFGIAMVVIGSTIHIEGRGAGLIVALSERLREPVGPFGMWLFLLGAWGAIASSLLGVWQSVPYLFADSWYRLRNSAGEVSARSKAYTTYLLLIAILPCLGLFGEFRQVQKIYSIVGAAFLPAVAGVLLYLNGSRKRVGALRNRLWTSLALLAILFFFAWAGWLEISS